MENIVRLAFLALACTACGGSGETAASQGGASSSSSGEAGGAAGTGGATSSNGSGGGSGGGGAGTCSYTPTPHAVDFRTDDCAPSAASPATRLTCAIAKAAAHPTFDPPADTMSYGPNAPQGVVRISFDAKSAPFKGTNQIVFAATAGDNKTFVDFASNVRLEIDSGVSLAYADPSVNGQVFDWDGVANVTITRGDPCNAKGRFVVDLDSFIDGMTDQARFITLHDVSRFLLEHVHTLSAFSPDGGSGSGNGTGAPTVLFHAATNNKVPRFGIYRHHSNQGSASGWGANQIASLSDSYITDIWSDGGDVLRFETSTGTIGSQRVTAEHVFGQHGFLVVALTPHGANSNDVQVSDVNGVSMNTGVGAFGTGPAGGTGVFTSTTVSGGCIVAGSMAEESDGTTGQSTAAVVEKVVPQAQVKIENISRSGTFTSNQPGGTTDASCTATSAAARFEDWYMMSP
jgi:hypothetical protein